MREESLLRQWTGYGSRSRLQDSLDRAPDEDFALRFSRTLYVRLRAARIGIRPGSLIALVIPIILYGHTSAPDRIRLPLKLSLECDMIRNGGEVRFGAKVTGLGIADGALCSVMINDSEVLPTTQAVLAIGHSARDTFTYLDQIGIPREAKASLA